MKKPNGKAKVRVSDSKAKSPSAPPFVKLPKSVVDSPEFAGLSSRAVHVLVMLCRQFNGHNNGQIAFGCRKAGRLCRCSYKTGARALNELVNAKLISVVQKGRAVQVDVARATTWRINFLEDQKCRAKDTRAVDATAAPASQITSWPSVSEEWVSR